MMMMTMMIPSAIFVKIAYFFLRAMRENIKVVKVSSSSRYAEYKGSCRIFVIDKCLLGVICRQEGQSVTLVASIEGQSKATKLVIWTSLSAVAFSVRPRWYNSIYCGTSVRTVSVIAVIPCDVQHLRFKTSYLFRLFRYLPR